MAIKYGQEDSGKGSVRRALRRREKAIQNLPDDREQALDEYLAESGASDSSGERCKLIDDWDTGLDDLSDDSEHTYGWEDKGDRRPAKQPD